MVCSAVAVTPRRRATRSCASATSSSTRATHEVTRDGDRIDLTTTEFDLLRYLMRNPRRVLSREQILEAVWNYSFGGRTSNVDLYISYLRRKLHDGSEPVIHTVRGKGYQLRPPESEWTPVRISPWWRPRTLSRQLMYGVSALVTVVVFGIGVFSVYNLHTYVTANSDAELAHSLAAFEHFYDKAKAKDALPDLAFKTTTS